MAPPRGTPACVERDPRLFDSTAPLDHLQARKVCATCPMVRDCILEAVSVAGWYANGDQRGPDGTWGGLLWRGGEVVDLRRLCARRSAA